MKEEGRASTEGGRKDGWNESSEGYRSDDSYPHLSRTTVIMFTGNQFDLLFKLVGSQELLVNSLKRPDFS